MADFIVTVAFRFLGGMMLGCVAGCGSHLSRDIEGFLSQPRKLAVYFAGRVRAGGRHYRGLQDALLANAVV